MVKLLKEVFNLYMLLCGNSSLNKRQQCALSTTLDFPVIIKGQFSSYTFQVLLKKYCLLELGLVGLIAGDFPGSASNRFVGKYILYCRYI
jgi:hypothetical protein